MIRLDKIANDHVTGFKNVSDNELKLGQIVQITTPYPEADVQAATDALDATKNFAFLLHSTVTTNFRNYNPIGTRFALKKNEIGRGYYLTTGDIITLPKDMFEGADTLKVGDQVEPQASKSEYKKIATAPTYGIIATIIEDKPFEGKDAFAIHFETVK